MDRWIDGPWVSTHHVNILVLAQYARSKVILISGVPTNVDSTKEELAEKVAEHRTAMFAKDELMDSAGMIKVYRFKGFTSRWRTKDLAKGLRKVTLSRTQYTRARHKSNHHRTEINKKILDLVTETCCMLMKYNKTIRQ